MHRSRLSVLVILAAAAACSTHDDTDGTAILSQDRTLVAGLQNGQQPQRSPMPDACSSVTVAAQPAANKSEADVLTRRAYDAEMQGNVQEAQSLLRRAAKLDGTNKSAAYHLGLTSEALGDRTAAIGAYCRYLTLAPTTAESAEARQRVSKLSQAETRMSAGSVSDSVAKQRVAPVQAPATPRVTSAPVMRSARIASPKRRRSVTTSPSAGGSVVQSSVPSEPMITSREVEPTSTSSAASGDVVAASAPEPSVEKPAPAQPTIRRGPTRAQGAGIGAAAGAILGAATGRSVKSAIMGAAAGGLLGTMVGRGPTFVGRGIRP